MRANQLVIIVMTTSLGNTMRVVVLMWSVLTNTVFMSAITTIGRLNVVIVTVHSILVMEDLFLFQLVLDTVGTIA